MIRFIDRVRSVFDSIVAVIELRAAEIRTGVSLVEAVAADGFETELRAVTSTEAQRAEMRRGAILLAQMGMTSADEAAAAVQRGMTQQYTRMRDLQWAKGKPDAVVDRRVEEIWNTNE